MDEIVNYMLREDEGFGDITSNLLVDEDQVVRAEIVSNDCGVLAGAGVVREILEFEGLDIIFNLVDGSEIGEGDLLFLIEGSARSILLLERTILNLLMRMSGVATISNRYVSMLEGESVIVAGTRKVLPGMAKFDKMALEIGGADSHRFSLNDMVLIKDNHISIVGSPLEALRKAQCSVSFSKKIEIEVETVEDAIKCVENNADIVMLDNMGPCEVREVLDKLDERGIRDNSLIEVSGGINKDNIFEYSRLGVDIISLGELTHSAKSLNFSLNIVGGGF